ncbi:MAG TPA: 2-dehydropantoate 2-reductase [Streptosporangiaceae bacterium]|jgi:2-dehydropantoate 2-reductase
MKIAVFGTGGIGGYFGGRLAAAGHDVGFVARGAHLAALRRDGLAVRSVAGDFTVAPVKASDDPGELGPAEAVLLCVKTWQLPDAMAALPPLLDADTAVVTLQNGVEAPEQVAAAIGRAAVLPGNAKIFANIAGPGQVEHVGGPALLGFAEWDSAPSDRVTRLREALAGASVAVAEPADIWAELWVKFLFVVPLGGLGAVTGAPTGVLRSRPGTRRLLADAMTEIAEIAAASGIKLPGDIVTTTMGFIDASPAAGQTSLQRDIWAGRPSELEAWTGAVVRLGAKVGTPTPVAGFLYEMLTAREASR